MSTPPVVPLADRVAPGPSSGGATESDTGIRELMAVRAIAQAFLTADDPADVYQLALERVSPLVGATLACVYLIDRRRGGRGGRGGSEGDDVTDDPDVMRLAAAHNWPARYAGFLGAMRVRVGSGPSGRAASTRRVVEVADVLADPALEDWREVSRELGFRSLVALPLQTSGGVHGAVTFYFAGSNALSPDARGLLRVVADQMAATAEKTRLIDDLRHANVELERQYTALVEARRLQDEFLANVSHELRTPLTSVLGYLSLIDEGLAGPLTAEQRDTLSQVQASSEKLLGLVTDLLDLTALKRSELTVSTTTFDARDAVSDALARAGSPPPAVALVDDTRGSPVLMTSDRPKVTRILSAIVANAFKFTEQGEVRVAMELRGDRCVWRIADTGIGISDEAREFIFDEFRQEDGSPTRRFGGSGLGLALARQLAQLLGGGVSVSSARGQGSTFEVDLPLVSRR